MVLIGAYFASCFEILASVLLVNLLGCREKRLRFPKGKKVKQGEYVLDPENTPSGEGFPVAAKDSAILRNKIPKELSDGYSGFVPDVKAVEVKYQVSLSNELFIVHDGIFKSKDALLRFQCVFLLSTAH